MRFGKFGKPFINPCEIHTQTGKCLGKLLNLECAFARADMVCCCLFLAYAQMTLPFGASLYLKLVQVQSLPHSHEELH